MTNVLHWIGTAAYFATTLGFVTFCVLYHILADWRASKMGRHMMLFMGVCAFILCYSIFIAYINLPEAWRIASRMVIYGALCAVVWRQIVLLVKEQVRARRLRRELFKR